MATVEVTSQGSVIPTSGGEMAGILHLNPTPLAVGSGEAVVYNKSFNANPHTGITIIEIPQVNDNASGNVFITITGFNTDSEANGGGAWTLIIGGTMLAGQPEAEWANYNAYYAGNIAFTGPQTVNLLAQGEIPNGQYAIALGTNLSTWNYQSLQIKVQSGYDTNDYVLQTPWTVTFEQAIIPVEWTFVTPVSVRRGVNKSGDTMTGTLNMAGNRITTVGAAVNTSDVVIKSQLDATALRRGALVSGGGGVIAAGAVVSFPNLVRLSDRDSVIGLVNRSGVTGYSWAVTYESDVLFTIYIRSLLGVDTNFGTFHFYMAPTV